MKKTLLLLLTFLCAAITKAQLTGTLNIPGSYPSLAAAITDLNAQGVGAGGVTLNLLAGNPQTAPAGGYSITASGTVANQITIQGNGNTVTASGALTAGSLNDAVFKLVGADYVTLTGFIMRENAANTTTAAATNNMTEWGVALLYGSTTDGAQNNTISNNNIALDRTYSNTFGIYSNVRHSAADVVTLADITNNTTAPNSNNKVYTNTIANVNHGIVFIGSATAANMDVSNDIGGGSLATGNTVNNYGGLGAATAYVGFPTTIVDGAYINDQVNFNLSFNSFISASLNTTVALRGILTDYAALPVGSVTNNVNSNTVTFTQAGTGGLQGITSASTAGAAANVTMNMNGNSFINNAITGAASAITIFGVANLGAFGTMNMNANIFTGNTSTATTGGFIAVTNQGAVVNTINLNNNQVGAAGANAIAYSAATTAQTNAILNTAGAATATVNINNNTIQGLSYVTSGQISALSNQASSVVATNITNNQMGTAGRDYCTFSGAQTSTVIGIFNTNGLSTGLLTITGNDIRRINHTVSGTSAHIYIQNQTFTGSVNISSNTFTNITANTTGSITFIGNSISRAAGASCTVNNNSVVTGYNKTGAGGTILFYNSFGVSPTANSETNTGNNFSNMTFTGATTVTGWRCADGTGATGVAKTVTNNIFSNITFGTSAATVLTVSFANSATVSNNTISNISAGGALTGLTSSTGNHNFSQNTISGLSTTGAAAVSAMSITGGTTQNLSKNKIYDIEANNAAGTVNGILISSGTTVNVSNNLIGNLRAPSTSSATDAVRGISITSAVAAANINVHYNTIYLNAVSTGANFATSGLFHTTSTTATTASLTMRNNIIYNNSFANGTGIVAAFKRSSGAANTLNNYNAASNNNLLFAGTPSANRLIYYDGTSSAQTLAAYQAGVFTAGTIAPRDNASRTELSTPFLSTAGANANFLHIDPAVQTAAESGGINIAGVTDDYDGDVRNVATPDIGADEFNGIAVAACAGTPAAGAITGSTNICQGQSTVLTLSGYSPNSGISLQWQSSAVSGGPYAPIAGETGATYNTGVIPTGTTVYYVVTVTCANGGANATTVQFSVTSNASPTIAVNPPAPSICTGGAGISLTASGALTYTWSPATGLSATTGATVTANPATTTTYTVTGTNAAGCTNTANVTVTVNTAPVVTTSATPAAICAGANSQLNSTVNLGPPASSYSRTLLAGQTYAPLTGGGITIINTNAQLTPTMGGATQDDGGVVITLPFTFTYLGNTFTEMSMCTNGWVGAGNWGTIDAVSMRTAANLFTGTIPNNTIAAWFKDMGANFPLGTGSMRHGLIGTDVYAFQWDNANGSGFGDGATNLISFQVNIYGPASATPGRIEFIYGPTVGAITFASAMGIEDAIGGANHYINSLDGSGTSVTTSTAWPGNGNGYRYDPLVASYLWSPATFLSSTTIPNPVATAVTATTTYTLTVSSPNGCSTPSNVTVTVLSPVVSATLVQPATCVTTDGSITLNVSGGTGGVGPYSYAWVGPGVNPTSQNQVNLGVGSYTVTVTDVPSGCTTIQTYLLPGPGGCNICPTVPTLTTNPTPAVCQNANVTLTASGLTNMGVTYGITFKYSNVALADPYTGGTVIATVPNAGLTAGGTVASTVATFPATGNYFIYAILSPLPVDITCRPFAQTTITVNPLPTVNAVANQAVCSGQPTAAVTFSGSIAGTVYNWTNSNPAIGLAAAGTGNIPSFTATNGTPGAISGTITVTPVYTGAGTTCTGTPITFTITVNSNLPLVIVAVPGTTLCQGDPAALTVYEQGPPVATTLTQSTSTAITQFNSVSCNAGGLHTDNSYWRAYNLATFGLTGPITINTVTFGIEQAAGGPQPVTVNLYTQTTGTFPTGTRTLVGTQNLTVPNQALSLFTGTFTTPVTVPNTAVLIVELFTPSGQATGRSFFIGSNAAAQTGPSYISAAPCGVPNPTDLAAIGFPNMHIILNLGGTTPGIGGIATGTFLWSPAAGLSSTTSNPTAASPATTTTYTVVRTTGAGCIGSANITLNVNTRPTVTAQPTSVTACATSTATFSVTGTGTGVTYQWQVSTTGSGGPWTNIPAGVPYTGVNTPNLIINPVTVAMNGYQYRCVLSGTCPPLTPGSAHISNPAVLSVNALPVVTVTPATGCGGVPGVNGLLLTASGATSYTWAPIAGLYTSNTTTPANAYTGGNTATVYAAPTGFTAYTVTGTNGTTGCSNTASAFINYTPPAPTVTPASVTMCLGDPAVRLVSGSTTPGTCTTSSGTISIPVPDNTANGVQSNLSVTCVPPGAIVTGVSVNFNMANHTYVGDMIFNLKAPNGTVLNLIKYMSGTATQAGAYPNAGYVNTTISSTGTAVLGTATTTPITGTWRADLLNGVIPFTVQDPAGFPSTATNWNALYSTGNGTWTLAMADGGPGDLGTLTSWSITINYVIGVPSTQATWSPIAGLFNDANATIPYTGTPRDTVWTMPTPSGVYPYQVTVQSLPPTPVSFANPAPVSIPVGGNGTPYPSNLTVSGLPTAGVTVQSVVLTGLTHTWADDVDILLQSPGGQNVVLLSDIGGIVAIPNATYTLTDGAPALNATAANPTGTYRPTNNGATDDFPAPGPGVITQANPTLATFTGNMNGVWRLFVLDDDGAGDQGNLAGGYAINFNVVSAACTSPARTVIVTVNQPTTVVTQPVNQTICTDKVATFTIAGGGSGPFAYQWQVSTDNGNTWSNIANGGVYAGATAATLVVTAPPVTLSGNFYRCIVTGAAPCASVTSFLARLTVNPLPTVVITAAPYTRLLPGLRTTLSSTVSPNAAQTYSWIRNGSPYGGNTSTLALDVDQLGEYRLTVTDVNGCTNTSNSISILDSASGSCFIYPNPSSGEFDVRYYSVLNNSNLPRTVSVYNAAGVRVLTQAYTLGAPYQRMHIDMRKYGKGLYWVEVGDRNGNRITMCRVVIQ